MFDPIGSLINRMKESGLDVEIQGCGGSDEVGHHVWGVIVPPGGNVYRVRFSFEVDAGQREEAEAAVRALLQRD